MGSNKEDFKITEDEVKKIGEALKDEKFRKLFIEYAEEIQNPENRKLYEQEIAQLEQERGMDVQFIHPQPGHVLKTSVDGDVKAFINICQNDKIGKPVAKREVSGGKNGINWSIPHSHTPPREDLDKGGKKCRIYDVVFHPDTYRMATSNKRFKDLVEDTALDGIEKQFGVKVDKKNMKHPKMTYKGTPTATVIRSKTKEPGKPLDNEDPIKDMPYPYGDMTSEERAKEMAREVQRKQDEQNKKNNKTKRKATESMNSQNDATIPKYTITHRSDIDFQDFTSARDSGPSTRPRELVISIELPLLSSSKPVELDIFEQKLTLKTSAPSKYALDLKLPYPVDDEQGSAKFDKSKRCLVVTLPVIKDVSKDLPPVEECQTEKIAEPVVEASPLIEVISNAEENKIPTDSETKTCQPAFVSHSPKVLYDMPPFDYSQDNETITLIFNVKKIASDSVCKSFPLPNVCHIKFMTKGSSGFPTHYSFLAKFPAKNCFVPDHSSVDVSENNAVLLLLKEKTSRDTWVEFQAGTSLEDLKDFTFDTEWTLFDDLERIEAECIADKEQSDQTLEVTEMTRKKLSIKIQKKPQEVTERDEPPVVPVDADDELEDEDAGPLSAEIEVVHKKALPNLHSILKQRSISESSEDHNNSASSPDSPRDDLFKKSVSFNEHIDQATFKPKAAVSSMTQALKSKRRRMRKKQEKRNRKNSGSSDGSSDEHRHSDSQCDTGKEVESIEENTTGEDENDMEPEQVENKSEMNVKQEKLVQDIKDKLSLETSEEICDSDDDMDKKVETVDKSEIDEDVDNTNKEEGESIEEKVVRNEEDNSVTIPASMINNPSDLTNLITENDSIVKIKAVEKTSGEDSGVECGEGNGDKGNKSEVETCLNWSDNTQSQEHKTECAFEFTNATIYDLDVD